MARSLSQSPTRVASGPLLEQEEKDYDEERLQWGGGSAPRWSLWSKKSSPRQPRSRKVKIWLFIIDVFIFALVVHAFSPLISLLQRNEELFGARLSFSRSKTEKTPVGERTIPRILHQTVANDTIPEKWTLAQKSCKETYADFEYKLWTDASARDFIAEHYGWFVETFDNYPFGIQRADSLRYFVLHHYGGMYVDMDTLCTEQIPFDQLEADGEKHHAVFKSTKPTGVSNDLMITSAHHPVFDAALSKIKDFSEFTTSFANILPYVAIMISAGPMFITFAIKSYLIQNPGLPETDVQVINATMLAPYITDLEAASWHQGDAQALMFIGERPWIWYGLGFIGFCIGLYFINKFIVFVWTRLGLIQDVADSTKVAKLT